MLQIRPGSLPRVLFVDDEPNILESIRDSLRRHFDVVTATSGAEGLHELAKQAFAVVVSDFQMPGMNGAKFLAQARIVSPQAIRILLTGQASVHDAIEAVNHGNIFRFLTKPCSPPDLKRALDDAIEQARLVTADRELLERKLDSMSQHLRRAERLASLGTLTGAIGHELNNMLAVFRCSLEMIDEAAAVGQLPDPEDLQALQRVEAHLANHARNLLDYGRPRKSTRTTDLGHTVREAVELLRAGCALRHIDVEISTPSQPVLVEADRGETEQVMINLIKNAAEATIAASRKDRRKPRVAIDVATAERATCVVRDNGIGIPCGNLPLIFEPYFTTRADDTGTGLGLFVVKQIVERYQGNLRVGSEEGVGTTFTVELPIARAA
jgi:signal transduction histidine kinase